MRLVLTMVSKNLPYALHTQLVYIFIHLNIFIKLVSVARCLVYFLVTLAVLSNSSCGDRVYYFVFILLRKLVLRMRKGLVKQVSCKVWLMINRFSKYIEIKTPYTPLIYDIESYPQ